MASVTELRPGDPAGLGGYTLRGRLGEGGQGVVYLGADRHGRLAAVKWLRPHLAGDAVAAERFAREAAAAQRVAPFCTAQVLATGVWEGRPYIVSEYVDGPSLRQVVTEEGPRPEAALYRLAIGTATALAAVHRAGIVHRDLSATNVLLGGEGWRIIDFGIARALDATPTITVTPVGTPAYMAPEQILDQRVGPAADMFAWGCLMVYAATGREPFAAGTAPLTVQRVLYTEPDLTPLGGPLRDLVAACLAKDAALRPTAEQVIRRLLEQPASNPADVQQATAVLAVPAPPPPGREPVPGGTPPWAPPGGRPPGAGPSAAPGPVGAPGAGPHPQPRPVPPPPPAVHPRPGPPAHPQPGPPIHPQPGQSASAMPGSGGHPGPGPYGTPGSGPYGGGRTTGAARRKGLGFAVAVAATAVVVLVAVIAVVVVNLRDRPDPVRTSAGTASPSPTRTPVPTTGLVTSSPAGTSGTLYESPADPVRLTTYKVRDPKTQTWVYYARDTLTGPFTKYPDLWENIMSPDGRYLAGRGKAFVDGHDTVRITDRVTGGTFTVATSRQPLSAYVQAWSRDSTRVLVNLGNPVKGVWQSTGFAIVNVTTRQVRLASLREGSLKGIRYGFDHLDSGVVALANDATQQALRFFDPTGRRVRHIPNVGAAVAESLFSPSGERFVTNCPGLGNGANCVYDAVSGAELERFTSPCVSLATWYDDEHVVCWVWTGPGARNQLQVLDLTGTAVRTLLDMPANATNLDVIYTYTRP